VLEISDLSLNIHSGNFWYNGDLNIQNGAAEIALDHASFSVEVKSEIQALKNGKMGPKFEVINSSANLAKTTDHVTITVNGQKFVEFNNVLQKISTEMIKSQLTTMLNT